MPEGQPYVSVIIPTFNRRQILSRALSALATQTYPAAHYEIIVVDDGSTDGTEDLLANFRPACSFTYFTQENRGPAAARNRGIRAAKGELCIFVDSDLIVVPGFIAAHVQKQRHIGKRNYLVHGPVIYTTNLDNPNLTPKKLTDFSRAFFATGNVSFYREQLFKAGLFDEDFREYGWEDLELGVRLKRQGMKVAHCPEAIGYHYKPRVALAQLPALCERERQRGHTALLYFRKQPTFAVKISTMLAWPFFVLDRLIFCGNWPGWRLTRRLLAFLERKRLRFLLVPLIYLIAVHAYFEGMREAKQGETYGKGDAIHKGRFITRAGLIAALYLVLTVAFGRLSFGVTVPGIGLLQFRPSEALTVLPILYPEAIPGLFIGCLLANIAGGLGPWDIFGGSSVTLLAALLTFYFKRSFLAYLSPIVLNALLISLYLKWVFQLPYWLTVLGIGISQAVVVLGMGVPLIAALRQYKGR